LKIIAKSYIKPVVPAIVFRTVGPLDDPPIDPGAG
jgi:hypothetical protein